MNKELNSTYREIRDQIMDILSNAPIWKKAFLVTGLLATGFAMIMLIINAVYWLILFLAGISILSVALRKSSSS